MSARLEALAAAPLEKGMVREVVPLSDLPAIPDPGRNGYHIEHECAVLLVPDDATGFSIGCEYATLGKDQTKNLLKVKAFISLDGVKWDFLMSFTATGGPEFMNDGVTRHSDPQITGMLPEGKGRMVKVVYIPLVDVKTSIAARCL